MNDIFKEWKGRDGRGVRNGRKGMEVEGWKRSEGWKWRDGRGVRNGRKGMKVEGWKGSEEWKERDGSGGMEEE